MREQFFMLLIDEEAALAAIPALLPPSADERREALAAIREVHQRDAASSTARRLERMEQIASCSTAAKPTSAPRSRAA